ncbi:MAG: hypothetical protein Athens101410_551 [Parcubacteria group bacterium Athens1014_10]|nr:MAG: hypothetical protein Athens101410_551 [Parcubacteria group bacterium Athens1014_10]TSD04719.1 MAG: hypothetical protein Athens071412_663 [Parcubacteria group bacterium Athens0714_12]
MKFINKKQIFLRINSLLILLIGIFLPINHNQFIQAKKSEQIFIEIENNSVQEDKWVEKECEVTMYTLKECGKSPKHPFYGITASGAKVLEGRTIAASPEIPFETEIKISGFENSFVVEDRGGMIKTYRGRWPGALKIDIYTKDKDGALEWGRQKVKCRILDN